MNDKEQSIFNKLISIVSEYHDIITDEDIALFEDSLKSKKNKDKVIFNKYLYLPIISIDQVQNIYDLKEYIYQNKSINIEEQFEEVMFCLGWLSLYSPRYPVEDVQTDLFINRLKKRIENPKLLIEKLITLEVIINEGDYSEYLSVSKKIADILLKDWLFFDFNGNKVCREDVIESICDLVKLIFGISQSPISKVKNNFLGNLFKYDSNKLIQTYFFKISKNFIPQLSLEQKFVIVKYCDHPSFFDHKLLLDFLKNLKSSIDKEETWEYSFFGKETIKTGIELCKKIEVIENKLSSL